MVPYIKDIKSTSTTNISEVVMQKAIDELEETADSKVDFIVCSAGVKRNYQSYLSSYRSNVDVMNLEGGFVCQCPRRAILISTVPSGSPHKYWLSSPIFAGICLNILKSSIFPLFLVLFIICSYLDTFYTSSDTVNIILYLPI